MQDKYVGDVGDFGKYILLNELCKNSPKGIKLGINWYRVKGDKSNKINDKLTRYNYMRNGYKNAQKYKDCSEELYFKLKNLVMIHGRINERRSIEAIESAEILPKETIFYSSCLPDPSEVDTANREPCRCEWFKKSLKKFENGHVDIIFLDPDTGIQPNQDMPKKDKEAIHYVFKDEIEQYYRLGKSLIIYNHKDRKSSRDYNQKIRNGMSFIKDSNDIKVMRFRKFSVRDYIFLIQKEHKDLINTCATITYLTRKSDKFLLFEKYKLNEANE